MGRQRGWEPSPSRLRRATSPRGGGKGVSLEGVRLRILKGGGAVGADLRVRPSSENRALSIEGRMRRSLFYKELRGSGKRADT